MIKESFDDEVKKRNDNIDFKTMILLAIATSIDALAVGITFSFYKVNILLSSSFIGIITFCVANIGVLLGVKFGDKFQNKAEIIGGVILIFIGLKILLEDLGVISIL